MSEVVKTTFIWGPWLLWLAVFELLAVFKRHEPGWLQSHVFWTSLSRWTWTWEKFWWGLPWVVLVGLAVLLVHLSPRLRP